MGDQHVVSLVAERHHFIAARGETSHAPNLNSELCNL